MMMTMLSVPTVAILLLQVLVVAYASVWGDDVRNQQCRASVNDALHVFGPATASGRPTIAIPQQCSFIFPGLNTYSKGNEVVIGEFEAPDCGSCAAACAASYKSVTFQATPGAYYFQDEVVETMTPSGLTDFRNAMLNSVKTCSPCTDWVYCSPEVAVVTTSTSLQEEQGPNGTTYYYVPQDPAFQDKKCLGRYNSEGKMMPYGDGYLGYGPDLCLVKSTSGCNNPTPDRQKAPGTCTLKFIQKTTIAEHFPQGEEGATQNYRQFSSQDYFNDADTDTWDYVDTNAKGEEVWSKGNTNWDYDGCPDDSIPYPSPYAEDLSVCPNVDPGAGIWMSGMCNWTPGIQNKPLSIKEDLNQCSSDNFDDFKSSLDSWYNDALKLVG